MDCDARADKKAVWVLSRMNGFGIRRILSLKTVAGDLNKLLEPEGLEQFAVENGFGPKFAADFESVKADGSFEREMDQCLKDGIRLMTFLDDDYPKNLAQLYDPPVILYVKGTLIPEDEIAIAVVGSRLPTVYGRTSANRLAAALAEAGITVVSGLARGIDGEAHRGACRVRGRTIAVLGSGLDVIYPKEHHELFEQIAAQGAILSELPLGTQPCAYHFPKRNRIITGLSLGVVVVEASERSGSLITASLAAQEGREVYAVPGPIDSATSRGSNRLIQQGAKLVCTHTDILEDLAPELRALTRLNKPDQKEERSQALDSVLDLIPDRPLYLEEIAHHLGSTLADTSKRLTDLELQGRLKRLFGGRYVKCVEK